MSENKNFDLVTKKNLFITIPCAVLAVMLIVIAIFGAEVSIEFKGGTILTYSYTGDMNLNDVSSEVSTLGFGGAKVTKGSAFNSDMELINIAFSSNKGLNADEQENVTGALREKFPDNSVKIENNQNVNPTTGSRFFLKCLVAVLFSFLMLMIYIAFRFKKISGWSAGVFALAALLVDVLMVVAAFVFFRLPIDANFMAVVLTIMGYSINSTIVVYDRVRENRTLYGKKITNRELINLSVRQSLTRAINTTVTTALAVVVICVVAIVFGVSSILSFAFPMLVGLISGVYTSLCLSGTLWVTWQEYKEKKAAETKLKKA